MIQHVLNWAKRSAEAVGGMQCLLRWYARTVCHRYDELLRMGDRLPPKIDISRLGKWLEILHTCKPAHERASKPSRHVLLFSVMPFWVEYCVPIAIVLAARGYKVDLVYLPYVLFDRPEPNLTHASSLCRLFPIIALHPRLSICNLLHVKPAAALPNMVKLAEEFSKQDPPYIHRRETVDLYNDENMIALYRFRVERNLQCMSSLYKLINKRKYDSMIVPQGDVYEFAAAYQLANMMHLPCITFAMCDRKGAILASPTPYGLPDTEALWLADAPHELTPNKAAEVENYLKERELPNWNENNYRWRGQVFPVEPATSVQLKLGLSSKKPTALLCSSVAWDAAVLGAGKTFPTMSDWVLSTVKWFIARPDWQLVVRCHPGELEMPSAEPIEDLLAKHYPSLPSNIKIVRPGDSINTYALMQFVDLGLVFVTTTGLEMAARGITVITTGKSHYSGKGFTIDPQTPSDYYEALKHASDMPVRLGHRQIELARCYIHLYNTKVSKPFPWSVTTMDEDLQTWPLQAIVGPDCPDSFAETFDYLAGEIRG